MPGDAPVIQIPLDAHAAARLRWFCFAFDHPTWQTLERYAQENIDWALSLPGLEAELASILAWRSGQGLN